MIYVVQCTGSGFCKIGYTKNETTIKQRIVSLQTGNPSKVLLVGTTEGGTDEEVKWHQKMYDKHVRNEWFNLGKDDVEKILGHSSGYSDIESMQADLDFIKKKCRRLEKTLDEAMRWNEQSRIHIENLLSVMRR